MTDAMPPMPLGPRLFVGLLRFAFGLLYNQLAWTYDLVAWVVSVGRWNEWIETVRGYIKGPRVLELGHGPGHLQGSLLKQGGLAVYGLDLSAAMGRQAMGRLRRQRLTPALVQADGRRIPLADGCMDTLTATFPTEYIIAEDTLAEAWRVLAPGGRLVIAPLAWITGKGLVDRLAALLFRITGQAPDIGGRAKEWEQRALEPLARAGFAGKVEWVEVRQSVVMIIVGEKKRRE